MASLWEITIVWPEEGEPGADLFTHPCKNEECLHCSYAFKHSNLCRSDLLIGICVIATVSLLSSTH